MRLLAVFVAALLSGTAPGHAAAPSLSDAQIVAATKAVVPLSNATYEQVLAALTQPIRRLDINGDGLDRNEILAADGIGAALRRSLRVALFLRADFNNDQRVTRAEYDLAIRNDASFQGRDASFDAADLNHDGVLDWPEITTSPPTPYPVNLHEASTRYFAQTLAIDPTPDTPFTIADATTVADGIFARLDTNGDHVLEANELEAVRNPQPPTVKLGPGNTPVHPVQTVPITPR
jgi:hypothetical protein